MYLNFLTEEEKFNFMKMAYLVVNIDGDFAQEEKNLINQYEQEMDLEIILKNDEIESLDVDHVIESFDSSNHQDKKIILTELLGLVLSDEKFEAREKEFVDKFIKYHNITNDFYNEAKILVENINHSYKKLNEIILAE